MSIKIGFVSLGCAKNLTDTETMLGLLLEDGYEITAEPAQADVLVVNTCAFIDAAKEESIGAILDMAAYKEQNCRLLIVAGCLSQRYRDEVLEQFPEVDAILGVNDYDKIGNVIKEFFEKQQRFSCVGNADDEVPEELPRLQSTPGHFAYLKIADGCDNHCTYCIIPKLRGHFRSRAADKILQEAKRLAAGGVKELILVAQDTACYGKDLNGYGLPDLLRELEQIEGIEWIRLQYCYPENITEELIAEMARNKKVVPYLDMPLQHVSDAVLKRMGRKSRHDEIVALIGHLRSQLPKLAIRTSIIVGFPGETEADFACLMEFMRDMRLDRAGVFPYSREEGTPAYDFPDQLPEAVKQERYAALMQLQQAVSLQLNVEKIGTLIDVIIEEYDEANLCYVGRSYADTPDVDGRAYVYSQRELHAGDIVQMRILEADEYDVTGEMA